MFHVCDDKLYVLRCYVILSRVTRDRRDTGPVTLDEVIQSMRNVLIETSYSVTWPVTLLPSVTHS